MPTQIFILALVPFAFGIQAFAFTGLLTQMADDLGVSIGTLGQLVTIFAIVYGAATPFVNGLTAKYDRKLLLLIAVGLLAVANFAAGLASEFSNLVMLRVFAAFAATLAIPVSATMATALAPEEKRSQALAGIMLGMLLAFGIGIPIGTALGNIFDWRATFHFAGTVCAVTTLVIAFGLPKVAIPGDEGLKSIREVFKPAVLRYLFITLGAFASVFCVFAYVEPTVTLITGLEGGEVGALQSVVGLGMLIGVALGGALGDKKIAGLLVVVSMLIVAGAQAGYSIIPMLGLPHGSIAIILVALITFVGSAAMSAVMPIVQSRMVGAAPTAVTMTMAFNTMMIQFGQGGGAGLGGGILEAYGLENLGWAGAIIGILTAIIALPEIRNHGHASMSSQKSG